jgi:hypothetical protein
MVHGAGAAEALLDADELDERRFISSRSYLDPAAAACATRAKSGTSSWSWSAGSKGETPLTCATSSVGDSSALTVDDVRLGVSHTGNVKEPARIVECEMFGAPVPGSWPGPKRDASAARV